MKSLEYMTVPHNVIEVVSYSDEDSTRLTNSWSVTTPIGWGGSRKILIQKYFYK